MVADPFKATATFRNQITGETRDYVLSFDDVAGNKATIGGTGADSILLPTDAPYKLIDVYCNEDGADTTQAELFANDYTTNRFVQYAQNVPTVQNRQFNEFKGMLFRPGAKIQFIQRA